LMCWSTCGTKPRSVVHVTRKRHAVGKSHCEIRTISGHNEGVTTSTQTLSHNPTGFPSRPNLAAVGTMVWLSSEVMFFGGLFAMYFTLRSTSPTLWEENTALLDPALATVNTIILVISSFTAQWGVKAAVQLRPRRTSNKIKDWGVVEWFIVSFILGSIILSVQSYEYALLVS